ncbi:hypothetical protein PR048_013292 [Dryococelus australis]|uniref:Uncharacterized protein n=1 Tax=Dryococelus australis TaxID=614101 RepID=A0ABQ9HS70_9NEOP|nr:hypothetical protein PR048_013292 [Dryococelus australis]
MLVMYLKKHVEENLQIEYKVFQTFVNENLNIRFYAPSTNKCSICIILKNNIKDERDKTEKHNLQMDYYSQTNLILPKLPDHAAYYNRQMCLFDFTICEVMSNSFQNKTNNFYMWAEDAYALHDVTTIRLFSDGCGGQNNNQIMIRMLSHCMLLKNLNI